MKKENKYHIFWRTLFILFVAYIAIYISVENGYYEKQNAKKAILTEEQIRRFEKDIKENKDVDINDYLKEEVVNYSSPLSNLAVKLSNKVEKITNKIINTTSEVIKKYFT